MSFVVYQDVAVEARAWQERHRSDYILLAHRGYQIIRFYAGRAQNVMVGLKRRAHQSRALTPMDVYQQKTGSRTLEEVE